MKRVTGIRRDLLEMIFAAARDSDPREFGALLRADKGILTELIIARAEAGDRSVLYYLQGLPADFSVVGSVHSHPSGVFLPSDEDRFFFQKFGGIHLIVGRPYNERSWAAYTATGERTALAVVEDR